MAEVPEHQVPVLTQQISRVRYYQPVVEIVEDVDALLPERGEGTLHGFGKDTGRQGHVNRMPLYGLVDSRRGRMCFIVSVCFPAYHGRHHQTEGPRCDLSHPLVAMRSSCINPLSGLPSCSCFNLGLMYLPDGHCHAVWRQPGPKYYKPLWRELTKHFTSNMSWNVHAGMYFVFCENIPT
ncbi:hypothetical protein M9458_044386, partial [Cirrhinus mrigala]